MQGRSTVGSRLSLRKLKTVFWRMIFLTCQHERGVSFKYIVILPRGELEVAFEIVFVKSCSVILHGTCTSLCGIEYAFHICCYKICISQELHARLPFALESCIECAFGLESCMESTFAFTHRICSCYQSCIEYAYAFCFLHGSCH